MRRARHAVISLLLCACVPASACAGQGAHLDVSFAPARLGHTTSVALNIKVATGRGRLPAPLTSIEVHYPSNLGLAVSELGLATCSPSMLEVFGLSACPADSRMGQGSARAEIPLGPRIVQETATVAIVRAPEQNGHFALLFYAQAESPITAKLLLPGLLLPGPRMHDETIRINLPLIHGLPGGPDVTITRLHATFGPRNLTYYEQVGGKLVAYRPRGILLPSRCPQGGFSFGATFTSLDGSRANAHARVDCPGARG